MLLLASVNISAQIVTSKKEAQKKGIYSYTENQAAQPASSRNAAPAAESRPAMNDVASVVAEPAKPAKEYKKGGPRKTDASSNKKRKLLTESEEAESDFEPETAPYIAQQIVNNAMQFEGVRYRGGGTTKEGMDCSGMVYATFKIFDITLPRSSRDMVKIGEKIKLSELRKGDLLFFDNNRSRKGINHVGIVTEITPEGEILFLHSSTSSGVIISSMNEPYYDKTFVQANRVIQE